MRLRYSRFWQVSRQSADLGFTRSVTGFMITNDVLKAQGKNTCDLFSNRNEGMSSAYGIFSMSLRSYDTYVRYVTKVQFKTNLRYLLLRQLKEQSCGRMDRCCYFTFVFSHHDTFNHTFTLMGIDKMHLQSRGHYG